MSACTAHYDLYEHRIATHLRKRIGGLLLSANSRLAVLYPAVARAGTLLQRFIQ